MTGALIEVTAAVLVTAAIMLVPGVALLSALRVWDAIPPLLRPAAAVLGSLGLAAPALVATLALHRSIDLFGGVLGLGTLLLGIVALLRWTPAARTAHRPGVRAALPYAVPAFVVSLIAAFDAPHVRSDTYWHVGLSRRLADLDGLASSAIAFEAGAPGNANYPLPVWHALVALADHAPRVDAWSATWFLTIWMAPVAMLAFGAMSSALVGVRGAAPVGCWAFVAVVVLGYGPWFFATRYLSYPGQVAIYLLLPLAVAGMVAAARSSGTARAAQLLLVAAATVGIGVLHGNYVLYPALFAGGGAVLMLVGRRQGFGATLGATAVTIGAGAATLAAQLPWLTADENFLRGTSTPPGEPSAFMRHRDVFVGSEQSFHVELGSLATQPWLVLGALTIPVVLLVRRMRPGPWLLAGGAVAIVVFARAPWLVDLLDRVGSVTPVTRLDRVYPAAVGVVGIALALGWMLERAWQRGRALGAASTVLTLAAIAVGSAWADSIRDTRRIVVTPFVEARWVGGLDPSLVPRGAVVAATIATVAVALWIRLRVADPTLASDAFPLEPRRRRHALAAGAAAAIALGLAPATADRLRDSWQPQAYASAKRDDREFSRIEVYPASVRAAILELPPRSVVIAGTGDARRIASLAPVHGIDEGALRELANDPPSTGAEGRSALAALVEAWDADYVAASGFDPVYRSILDVAATDPARYERIPAGPMLLFRVRRDP